MNRLSEIDYSDSGTPDVEYTYDELGRLLSVTTPASPSNKTVGYRYDRDGNRTKLIYPGGDAITYAFDNASRLTGLSDWLTPTPRQVGYAYYPDGALQTQTNPNGTVAAYSYDNARRLTEVWNKPSAASMDTITRHVFTMDAVGNRTTVAETLAPILPPPLQPAPGGLPAGHTNTPSTAPGGLPAGHPMTATTAPSGLPNRPGPNTNPTTQTLSYGYDKLYRLTSASGGPAGATSYSYDPVGNRLTRTRASTTTYAYDRADRIDSATWSTGGSSYTVNAVGNMTARGSDTLAYDQANRLTSTTVGSTTATYSYDGDGKRASKTVSSTTTVYLYDVNRGLPVLLEDGTRRYVWGLGLAYEVEGSAALVYHVDGLGSVRAITDSTKAVVQTYESDEFGIPISAQGGSTQPFGFTGEQRDGENGLTYLRARHYDPQIGRLISRDPVAGLSRSPQSLNRCAYAHNNPATRTDPSGLTSSNRVNQVWPPPWPRPAPLPTMAPIPGQRPAQDVEEDDPDESCGIGHLTISDLGNGRAETTVYINAAEGLTLLGGNYALTIGQVGFAPRYLHGTPFMTAGWPFLAQHRDRIRGHVQARLTATLRVRDDATGVIRTCTIRPVDARGTIWSHPPSSNPDDRIT